MTPQLLRLSIRPGPPHAYSHRRVFRLQFFKGPPKHNFLLLPSTRDSRISTPPLRANPVQRCLAHTKKLVRTGNHDCRFRLMFFILIRLKPSSGDCRHTEAKRLLFPRSASRLSGSCVSSGFILGLYTECHRAEDAIGLQPCCRFRGRITGHSDAILCLRC